MMRGLASVFSRLARGKLPCFMVPIRGVDDTPAVESQSANKGPPPDPVT